MADLEATESIDPARRREWIQALREADTKLVPLLIPTCRAYLALNRQAGERAAATKAAPIVAPPTAPMVPADEPAARPASTPPGPIASAVAATPQSHVPDLAERLAGYAAVHSPQEADATPRGAERQTPVTGLSGQTARKIEAAAGRSDAREVVRASYEPASPSADWRVHLSAAIEGLRGSADPGAKSPLATADQARLRILYLAAGRRDDALEPIAALDAAMQDFWSKELFGLATLMDPELISDPSRRTAEAKRSLDEALTRLGEASPLVVRNLAFVRRVDSWGTYEPFEKYEFVPNQKVLLYAEVENYKSNEGPKGCHTALRSSYQIFDSRGQRVADHEFNASEEYCRNPRHDYFLDHDFSLPGNVYPGKYVLQLTVADLNSQKIGQSSIEFAIKQANE